MLTEASEILGSIISLFTITLFADIDIYNYIALYSVLKSVYYSILYIHLGLR